VVILKSDRATFTEPRNISYAFFASKTESLRTTFQLRRAPLNVRKVARGNAFIRVAVAANFLG
jgi:hypothetical protein